MPQRVFPVKPGAGYKKRPTAREPASGKTETRSSLPAGGVMNGEGQLKLASAGLQCGQGCFPAVTASESLCAVKVICALLWHLFAAW